MFSEKTSATIRLSRAELQRLMLLVDEMSRLHVAGMHALCEAAAQGAGALAAAIGAAEAEVRAARDREHRQHPGARPGASPAPRPAARLSI